MDFDGQQGGWRWSLLLSVIFLNICLPSLILSYGVLWVQSVRTFDAPLWLGFATPCIFMFSFNFTQCWFREAADSWGGSIGYRIMASIGLCLVATGLLLCAFIPYNFHPYVYGIFCGLGSSLIVAQVDAVVFETYDSHLVAVRGLSCFGQAIGLSIFPHILTALIDTYGYYHSHIVIAAVMLQSLVGILLLNIDDNLRRPVTFSRYKDLSQTYVVYKNEGMDSFSGTELQLHNLNKKCWKNPSDDQLHSEEMNKDEGYVSETITPPPSPEEKRRNIFGVEILPQIPEESEESDVEDTESTRQQRRFSVAIKRLSTLGDNIDDCISNQMRRDSQPGNSDKPFTEFLEVKYENVSPMTDIQTEKLLNTFSFRCQSAYMNVRKKFWIPSYRMYRIRRRFTYLVYAVNDTLAKPLTRSLSCGKFYPALLLSFSRLSLLSILLALLPMLASEVQPKLDDLEMNFLMSLHSFTWICFLVSTPWLAQTPKRNYKYVVVIGLMVSTASAFVLAADNNHDSYSIGCVIAGFGFGALTSCWEGAAQDYIGARKWPKVHSALETISASLLAIFVVGSSFIIENQNGRQLIMFMLGIVLAVITIIWTCIVAVSMYLTKVKSLRLDRNCLF